MGEGANNNKRIDLAAPLRSVRRADAPPRYKADLKSGPIRHPGKVPFVWEQRPGQPKSVRTRRGPPPTPPRDAPPSLTRPEDVHGSPYHDALGELFGPVSAPHVVVPADSPRTAAAAAAPREEEEEEEAKQNGAVEAPAVVPQRQEDDNVEEDEEERFSDALDTLSRTESLTMNCSVSGLSGAPADAARGAAEPGARGFMMDRFLPAAHAVAVGSPQYTFRKAGAAGSATGNSGREHARAAAVRASMANGDDRTRRAPVQLPHQHLPPNYLSCAYPRREEHDEDEEDDDDDYDVQSTRGFSSKGCGLLPGLKVGYPNHLDCVVWQQSWEDVYKHKLEQKYLGHGDDGRSKLTSESNQLTFWSDSPSGDGSSPFHHSMAGGMSPYHSYAAMSPLSKANGSFRTGDRDEKARGSNGSGSLGRDHDRSSLVESDESSFKGSSSMSSGLDRTGHEDSMDHRGDIGPEIGHLSSLLETKADLNANVVERPISLDSEI
ncbi:hypothetical protein PR202_gb04695 [Eleusine coracana subsp. coracana]|uniref:Uncharacterized protein n=1 Tax=Eleusine coracana subsp. coracana TaxID=191504 RepID=A0AAV5E560_ELECO|nr:hypothetical protein PR202_gb04695 [Eleusine coracana subsp. coracana]